MDKFVTSSINLFYLIIKGDIPIIFNPMEWTRGFIYENNDIFYRAQ